MSSSMKPGPGLETGLETVMWVGVSVRCSSGVCWRLDAVRIEVRLLVLASFFFIYIYIYKGVWLVGWLG